MNELSIWRRKYYIIYVNQKYKLDLLRVANKLWCFGFHTETMLNHRCCFFGSLPYDVDPESVFTSITEITSWKLDDVPR